MIELKLAQEIIKEYSRRSKKTIFKGTDLRVLYKTLGQLKVFLESTEVCDFVPLCVSCGSWNSAPKSKKGWCSKGKGYMKKEAYCNEHTPRTEEQQKMDEYIRERLHNDAND